MGPSAAAGAIEALVLESAALRGKAVQLLEELRTSVYRLQQMEANQRASLCDSPLHSDSASMGRSVARLKAAIAAEPRSAQSWLKVLKGVRSE